MELSGQSTGKWISKRTLTQRVQQQQQQQRSIGAAPAPKNANADDYLNMNVIDARLAKHLHDMCSIVEETSSSMESHGVGVCAMRDRRGGVHMSTTPRTVVDIDVESSYMDNRTRRGTHRNNNSSMISNDHPNNDSSTAITNQFYSYSPNTSNSINRKGNATSTRHANYNVNINTSNYNNNSRYYNNNMNNYHDKVNYIPRTGTMMSSNSNVKMQNNDGIHSLDGIECDDNRHHIVRGGPRRVRNPALPHVDENSAMQSDTPRFRRRHSPVGSSPACVRTQGVVTCVDGVSIACSPPVAGTIKSSHHSIDNNNIDSIMDGTAACSSIVVGAAHRSSNNNHGGKVHASDSSSSSSNNNNFNNKSAHINNNYSNDSNCWSGAVKASTSNRLRDGFIYGAASCNCEVALPTPRSLQISVGNTAIVVGGLSLGGSAATTADSTNEAAGHARARSTTCELAQFGGSRGCEYGNDKKEKSAVRDLVRSPSQGYVLRAHAHEATRRMSSINNAHANTAKTTATIATSADIHPHVLSSEPSPSYSAVHTVHSSATRSVHGSRATSIPCYVKSLVHTQHAPSTKVVVGNGTTNTRVTERRSIRETGMEPVVKGAASSRHWSMGVLCSVEQAELAAMDREPGWTNVFLPVAAATPQTFTVGSAPSGDAGIPNRYLSTALSMQSNPWMKQATHSPENDGHSVDQGNRNSNGGNDSCRRGGTETYATKPTVTVQFDKMDAQNSSAVQPVKTLSNHTTELAASSLTQQRQNVACAVQTSNPTSIHDVANTNNNNSNNNSNSSNLIANLLSSLDLRGAHSPLVISSTSVDTVPQLSTDKMAQAHATASLTGRSCIYHNNNNAAQNSLMGSHMPETIDGAYYCGRDACMATAVAGAPQPLSSSSLSSSSLGFTTPSCAVVQERFSFPVCTTLTKEGVTRATTADELARMTVSSHTNAYEVKDGIKSHDGHYNCNNSSINIDNNCDHSVPCTIATLRARPPLHSFPRSSCLWLRTSLTRSPTRSHIPSAIQPCATPAGIHMGHHFSCDDVIDEKAARQSDGQPEDSGTLTVPSSYARTTAAANGNELGLCMTTRSRVSHRACAEMRSTCDTELSSTSLHAPCRVELPDRERAVAVEGADNACTETSESKDLLSNLNAMLRRVMDHSSTWSENTGTFDECARAGVHEIDVQHAEDVHNSNHATCDDSTNANHIDKGSTSNNSSSNDVGTTAAKHLVVIGDDVDEENVNSISALNTSHMAKLSYIDWSSRGDNNSVVNDSTTSHHDSSHLLPHAREEDHCIAMHATTTSPLASHLLIHNSSDNNRINSNNSTYLNKDKYSTITCDDGTHVEANGGDEIALQLPQSAKNESTIQNINWIVSRPMPHTTHYTAMYALLGSNDDGSREPYDRRGVRVVTHGSSTHTLASCSRDAVERDDAICAMIAPGRHGALPRWCENGETNVASGKGSATGCERGSISRTRTHADITDNTSNDNAKPDAGIIHTTITNLRSMNHNTCTHAQKYPNDANHITRKDGKNTVHPLNVSVLRMCAASKNASHVTNSYYNTNSNIDMCCDSGEAHAVGRTAPATQVVSSVPMHSATPSTFYPNHPPLTEFTAASAAPPRRAAMMRGATASALFSQLTDESEDAGEMEEQKEEALEHTRGVTLTRQDAHISAMMLSPAALSGHRVSSSDLHAAPTTSVLPPCLHRLHSFQHSLTISPPQLTQQSNALSTHAGQVHPHTPHSVVYADTQAHVFNQTNPSDSSSQQKMRTLFSELTQANDSNEDEVVEHICHTENSDLAIRKMDCGSTREATTTMPMMEEMGRMRFVHGRDSSSGAATLHSHSYNGIASLLSPHHVKSIRYDGGTWVENDPSTRAIEQPSDVANIRMMMRESTHASSTTNGNSSDHLTKSNSNVECTWPTPIYTPQSSVGMTTSVIPPNTPVQTIASTPRNAIATSANSLAHAWSQALVSSSTTLALQGSVMRATTLPASLPSPRGAVAVTTTSLSKTGPMLSSSSLTSSTSAPREITVTATTQEVINTCLQEECDGAARGTSLLSSVAPHSRALCNSRAFAAELPLHHESFVSMSKGSSMIKHSGDARHSHYVQSVNMNTSGRSDLTCYTGSIANIRNNHNSINNNQSKYSYNNCSYRNRNENCSKTIRMNDTDDTSNGFVIAGNGSSSDGNGFTRHVLANDVFHKTAPSTTGVRYDEMPDMEQSDEGACGEVRIATSCLASSLSALTQQTHSSSAPQSCQLATSGRTNHNHHYHQQRQVMPHQPTPLSRPPQRHHPAGLPPKVLFANSTTSGVAPSWTAARIPVLFARPVLEAPEITGRSLICGFRDTAQSHAAREQAIRNRSKPFALCSRADWPPHTAEQVEQMLKLCNAHKLLRHLTILCFSQQHVLEVQELFDLWARNGIPAPDRGFGAYYLYVKYNSDKLLCMKHNGRGATPGHGYGRCDFESRRPNSTCRYEHVCLFCRSRDHGWFDENRCEGYQQLLREMQDLGVAENDIEVMLDAMARQS